MEVVLSGSLFPTEKFPWLHQLWRYYTMVTDYASISLNYSGLIALKYLFKYDNLFNLQNAEKTWVEFRDKMFLF